MGQRTGYKEEFWHPGCDMLLCVLAHYIDAAVRKEDERARRTAKI